MIKLHYTHTQNNTYYEKNHDFFHENYYILWTAYSKKEGKFFSILKSLSLTNLLTFQKKVFNI